MRWVCAGAWMVPPATCNAHGDTDRSAERHTKETGHPTMTTARETESAGAA